MTTHATYVRIVGEPFLSRAQAYRKQHGVWCDAWGAFAKERGADGVGLTGRHLSFKHTNPPEGWTRPIGKSRMSNPKKGHPDIEALAQLRERSPRPDARAVFGDAVVYDVRWETANGDRGGGGIGGFGMVLNGPWVGWVGDDYLGWVPDAEAAVRDFLAEHPDRVIASPAAEWILPPGLIRITEAEYELILAQHKVDEERATQEAFHV